MGLIDLYIDYNIPIASEGQRHYRQGWINTICPFCTSEPGHEGFHLGYNLEMNYFVCFRCGWHSVINTFSKLLNVSESKARDLVQSYKINVPALNKMPKTGFLKVPFSVPEGTGKITGIHKRYLKSRKFDPGEIQRVWEIQGTGPFGKLQWKEKELNLSYRVFIPVFWNGKMVSYETRDVTGRHPSKYIACPSELEIIPRKHILYCRQEALMDTVIVVEGTSDVWRLGVNSVATFGINFTPYQVRLLAKMFKRTAICFDDEPQARRQADLLVAELRFRGIDSFRVDIRGDPGSLSSSEARYLVKQIINK